MMASFLSRLLWVRGLRAFADGYVSLLLPLYLISLGFGPFAVGIIATGTLLGSGVLTLLAGLYAWRFRYRTLLLTASALMAATGFGFAVVSDFWPLLVISVVGTLNPSSGDVSVFLPLEHALMSDAVEDKERTALFARYSLIGGLVAAAGSLSAGVPELAVHMQVVGMKTAMQGMFVLYGVLGLVSAWIYATLPREGGMAVHAQAAPLRKSKRIVFTLAALFSLDSFGGGFVVQSLVALWLYQKFQLSTAVAGAIFFWTGVMLAFLSGGGALGQALGTGEHHGVHASAVQLAIDPCAAHADPGVGNCTAAGAQRLVANGCSHAQLVRHGRSHSRRAASGSQHDGSTAQPGIGRQSDSCRLPPWRVDVWLAAGHRRWVESPLRPSATGDVSEGCAAGGGGK
jgi:MFS family permease